MSPLPATSLAISSWGNEFSRWARAADYSPAFFTIVGRPSPLQISPLERLRVPSGTSADTNVIVKESDLFDAVADESFDRIVVNPPYEVGRSQNSNLRSPDLLVRLAAEWATYAPKLLMTFPTDSEDLLEAAGFDVTRLERISTTGRELGVYAATAPPG